jgi:hypothetical protein
MSKKTKSLRPNSGVKQITFNASSSFGEASWRIVMKSKPVTISWTVKALAIVAFCFSFGVLTPSAPIVGATAKAQETKAQRLQRLQPIFNRARTTQALHQANATKYDTAIRNISALEKAPLRTEADVKKVIDTLRRNEINNNLVLGKGFTLAIKVNSFKAGVEAEASRVSAKGVATQLKSKSLSISRIGGFNDLKTTLKRQFDGDTAMLSRVGKRLQQASRQRGISLSSPNLSPAKDLAAAFAPGLLGERSRPNPFISVISYRSTSEGTLITSPVWIDAPRSEPPQLDPITGGVLAGVALAALAYLITIYAYQKEEDLDDDPETGVSPLSACLDEVKTDRDNCLSANRGDFWAEAGCWGKWTIDTAACLLLPN